MTHALETDADTTAAAVACLRLDHLQLGKATSSCLMPAVQSRSGAGPILSQSSGGRETLQKADN